jgi:asparagine synthase (glutamine-hydrolysing)
MCGIAGYAGFDDAALLRRMCASLAHRGPDDTGFHVGRRVGLCMTRLAVIDLETGHQPIANESREVWVVLNGEIYNYEALRADLVRRGHTLATTSDTETIVHLYEDHGLDFVQHLRGMFAIALWDDRRRRLVLVRDRVGEKPLFWARRGEAVLFGSEIKAILQGWGERQADAQAVCDFLAAGYVGGPRTFFRGIAKLEPGTMLVHEAGTLEIRRYWQPGTSSLPGMTFDDAVEELANRLSETVRLCLKSDVEVGAFLSGGLDSSVITALMRKHAAAVQTFSVGYDGVAAGFNELRYARRVATHLGTRHHELILGPRSSMELLPRILWHYDEPHGEPTSVLVYLLCEFTRARVKVAVGGTGGDELFFGYPRHKAIRLLERYRLLPRVVRKHVIERLVARWPESTRGSRFAKRAKRFVLGSDLPPAHAYLGWVSLLHADTRARLIAGGVRADAADPAGEAFLHAHLTGPDGGSLLDRAASLDIAGYLPEYQLAYMDRMSMAHGLEVRAPFCDFELLDFVTGLPADYRLRRGHSKHILKTVAARWIPRDIAERPKVGFDSPIGQWFKDELRPFITGFLSREHVARSGLLEPSAVDALIVDHLAGRHDHSLQLWSIVALEAWHRMYIEDALTDATHRLEDVRGAAQPMPASAMAGSIP